MSFTNQALSALGTITGAVAAGERIKQQKEANDIAKENQQIEALENEPKLAEELNELTGQEVNKENEINTLNAERDFLEHKAGDKRISELTRLFRTSDVMGKEAEIEKAQLALNTLQGKIEAKNMLRQRYQNILSGGKK